MAINIFVLNEEGLEDLFVIPPIEGDFELQSARLVGRLQSTRGGANYNWFASRGARELMSRAPYEPYINVRLEKIEVRSLGWHCHSQDVAGQEGFALSWGGTLVQSPATVYAAQVVDLKKRQERDALFASLKGEPAHQQGGLIVDRVLLGNKSPEDVEAEFGLSLYRPNRPVVLFNHAVFVTAAVGLDNRRLIWVDPDKVGQKGVVTSPDHPLETISLPGGWWLLEHPFPVGGKAD
jgi:hypothetical protein